MKNGFMMFSLGTLMLVASPPLFGNNCSIKKEHLNELAYQALCPSILEMYKKMKSSSNKSKLLSKELEAIAFCQKGNSVPISVAGTISSVLLAETFISRILIAKMLPLITDKMVDQFMYETGIDKKYIARILDELGEDPKEVVNVIERLRRDLAKMALRSSGFMPVYRTSGIKDAALLGAKEAFEYEPTMLDIIDNKGTTSVIKLQDKVVRRARAFARSGKLATLVQPAISSFRQGLGPLTMPLKSVARKMSLVAAAGTFFGLLFSSTDSACAARTEVNEIVDLDPLNACRPLRDLSPKVISGILNPEGAALRLNQDYEACLAYEQIYREYVLKIPRQSLGIRIQCSREDITIEWSGGEVQGYRLLTKRNSVFYRPRPKNSRIPSWIPISNPGHELSREMQRYCKGVATPLNLDHQSKPSLRRNKMPDVIE